MKYNALTSGVYAVATLLGYSSSLLDGVYSFQMLAKPRLTSCHATAKKSIDVDYFNPSRNLDMEHAHDCADHFGKCSIQDLEDMRNALHTERLQHESSGFKTDFAEELDHRLLEEDLEFQLALLKDEMHTLPRWSSPHFVNNGKPSFSPPPSTMMVPQQSGSTAATMTPPPSPSTSIQSMILRGEEMFLIPNGLADIAAFGLALLILSLTPFFFQ